MSRQLLVFNCEQINIYRFALPRCGVTWPGRVWAVRRCLQWPSPRPGGHSSCFGRAEAQKPQQCGARRTLYSCARKQGAQKLSRPLWRKEPRQAGSQRSRAPMGAAVGPPGPQGWAAQPVGSGPGTRSPSWSKVLTWKVGVCLSCHWWPSAPPRQACDDSGRGSRPWAKGGSARAG